ncbi:MAG: DUF222 domain-containing protein [Actinobacteria bacterium]|nr:DUF222 domain-containing protein [Actinomycetota bacterium]
MVARFHARMRKMSGGRRRFELMFDSVQGPVRTFVARSAPTQSADSYGTADQSLSGDSRLADHLSRADVATHVDDGHDRTASMDEYLGELLSADPSPTTMTALINIDPQALSGHDALTWLMIHERITSWWASLQPPAYVRVAGAERFVHDVVLPPDVLGEGPQGRVTIADAIREEVAAALRLSPATAQVRIDSSRLLAGPLAATRAAMAKGTIAPSHAAIVVSAAQRLRCGSNTTSADSPDFVLACRRLQDRVLPVAQRSTLARTRRAANQATMAIDPAEARRREAAAVRTCDVFVIDEPDGLSTLIARMGTEQAHACLASVRLRAKQLRPAGVDGRDHGSRGQGTQEQLPADHVPRLTAGEYRARALCELVLLPAATSTTPETTQPAGPIRAHVNLVIDLQTLLGLRDGSAELVGSGDISAEVARGLLGDATMRRLVTDGLTGELLDFGRRTYAVPKRLREFIAARDQTCRFPGCARNAVACQTDHAVPWSQGGGTDRDNLGALCTRHHQLKTHGGWSMLESHSSGRCFWQSPQGRVYEHESTPVLAHGAHSAGRMGVSHEVVKRVDVSHEVVKRVDVGWHLDYRPQPTR